MSEWRVRVTGKQRKDIDKALVIQAVIALGKQLERERREQAAQVPKPTAEVAGVEAPELEVAS